MNFEPTETQKQFKEIADRFAREQLAGKYQARENDTCLNSELVRHMGSLGLIGVELDEKYGGLGQSYLTAGIVMEALSYGDPNVAYVQLVSALAGQILTDNAVPHIAEAWVPRIVSGDAIVAMGITEPRGGSDAANLVVRAEKRSNSYILNGEKTSISFADNADAFIIFARTGSSEEASRGVSAILVPRNTKGVTTTRFDDLGVKVIGRGSVFLDNVEVPAENLLGQEGSGFVQVMKGFDYSRALIGLMCCATAQASLDETWTYTKERTAFGHPIAQYQGVTFPLAEAATQLTMLRQLCYYTLDLRDRGRPHAAEAAMCKWYGPKAAVEITHQCLLTHGHYGYTHDMPHQQRMRDIMGLEIGDGTAQIMKLVIAREHIGKIAVQYARQ